MSSTEGYGVAGSASASVGVNYGVIGQSNSLTDGWGVYAEGNMGCSGTKNFNIDHPLDPAHKYLNHFSAEGPEALLIYRGNVTLDPAGEAWVTLPSYFESINRDFTYQLTPVGAPAPALYIASEVKDNRFMVGGGSPGLKVSWTVTGVRNDAYVRAYPKAVEQDKPAALVGKYLHPQLFGQPETLGIFYRPSISNEVGVTPVPSRVQSEESPISLPDPVVPASPVNQTRK